MRNECHVTEQREMYDIDLEIGLTATNAAIAIRNRAISFHSLLELNNFAKMRYNMRVIRIEK